MAHNVILPHYNLTHEQTRWAQHRSAAHAAHGPPPHFPPPPVRGCDFSVQSHGGADPAPDRRNLLARRPRRRSPRRSRRRARGRWDGAAAGGRGRSWGWYLTEAGALLCRFVGKNGVGDGSRSRRILLFVVLRFWGFRRRTECFSDTRLW